MTISKAVGIDLGNAFSGVVVWKHDHATLIINDQGKRRVPTVVAYAKSARLVGDDATAQMIENPKGTIYDLKRLIGCHYYDFQVQDALTTWPFTVDSINGEPMVKIQLRRKKQQLVSAETLSAMVLRYLKHTAEEHIKTSVEYCVITVPVYFNHDRQQAIRKAATLAGFKSIHLLDEPVAAALAYSMHDITIDTKDDDLHHTVVIDFGGDHLQVTILNVKNGLIKAKTTSNRMDLGGKTLTAAMVDDVTRTIMELKGVSISSMGWPKQQRLQVACERIKRKLSFVPHATLALDNFFCRELFEQVNDNVFTAFMDCVEQALADAQLEKADIEDILLVGGSTYIPKVRQLLTEYFGQTPNMAVRAEEAVGLGAAIQAAVLKGDTQGDPSDSRWTLDEVVPLSLGAEVTDDIMDVFVNRGESLPTRRTRLYNLWNHKQKVFMLNVYQGERRKASGNTLLGTLKQDGHLLSRHGEGQVQVEFSLNHTGYLTVKAKCLQNGWSAKEIRIKAARRTKKNIKRMLDKANQYAEADKAFSIKVDAKHALETLAYGYLNSLRDADGTKESVDMLATHTLDWIKEHSHTVTAEDYQQQRQNLLFAVKTLKGATKTTAMYDMYLNEQNQYWYDYDLDKSDIFSVNDVQVYFDALEVSSSEGTLNMGSISEVGGVGVDVVEWGEFINT